MKRSLPARRLAVVLGLAVILPGLSPVAALAGPSELRAPFVQAPTPTLVLAASGSSILASAGEALRLTTDNGATWQPAAIGDEESLFPETVDAGRLVRTDYGQRVDVFDLATNNRTAYTVPSAAGQVWGASAATAVVWDGDPDHSFAAVDLATGSALSLQEEYLPTFPSGFDSNDEWSEAVFVGSEGAAYVTDYYLDDKQTATDIDPLPLDGSAGAAPFRVSGYVAYVGLVGDSVEYVKKVSTAVSLCSRPIAGGAEACTKIATLASTSHPVGADRSGDVIRLELNGVHYLWEAGALKKVAWSGSWALWVGLGDPTRPLLRVQDGTTGATFAALSGGAVTPVFDDLPAPVEPWLLGLGADRVVGLDSRLSAWSRTVGADAIADESLFPGEAWAVTATAGRTVVNTSTGLTFYDRGVKKASLSSSGATLLDASGPYALVRSGSKQTIRTSAGAVSALSPLAVFGSTYVGLHLGENDAEEAFLDDVATPRSPWRFDPNRVLEGTWVPEATTLWGDWTGFVMEQEETNADGEPLHNTHMYERAGNLGYWRSAYFGGFIVSLGDGVAVVLDENTERFVLWNYVTNARTVLDEDVFAATLDDNNRLAYADDEGLVVTTVPGAGLSAPRLLGTVAPASFNPNSGAWLPEFDTTKALAEGTLEISHGTGDDRVVDRVLSVPASADGSIRGVAWDGKDDAGEWVADGPYSWTLGLADAADPAQELVAIDGTSAASGTVTVKTANLGTATGPTPKVSDTTPTVDQELSVTTGTWTPATVELAYQWYRGSTAIPAATASTYVVQPADAGLALKVKVTGSCPGTESWCRGYASATKSSAATSTVEKATISPAPAPTLDVTAPVVDGAVTATVAPWGPDPVVRTYQWYKVNSKGTSSAISGAKAEVFTPTAAEVGYKLKLKVTGTKPGYTTKSVYSALTGKVAKASFASVADPTVTGSLKAGMPLTAEPGATDPTAKASYQWYRGTSAISGAKSATYTTTSSDLARQLKVRVTYSRSGYTSVVRYSAVTGPIEPGLVTATPKLDDTTPAVGQVLRITDATGIGAWTPGVTPAYQWYRDSSAISGASGASYEVQAADLGKAIKVKVTGSLDGYLTVTKTSSASSDVVKGTFTAKPAPTIEGLTDGTAGVGQTLTAVPGDWAPAPTSFGYVWYRSGSAISGQTAATYTLVAADAGTVITVKVTAIRSGFTSASATSAATGPILP